MRNPNAIRDHVREGSLFSGRAAVALVVVALLAMVLLGRLIFLQVFGHEHFATLSQNNRVNIQSIPPTRGLIYDRDGVVLAENITDPAFWFDGPLRDGSTLSYSCIEKSTGVGVLAENCDVTVADSNVNAATTYDFTDGGTVTEKGSVT